jgi:hypothetical protein
MSSVSSLGNRAADDLAYVRQVLDRAENFSAVPGLGGIGMGTVALGAAVVARGQDTIDRWLLTWVAAAVVACAVGALTVVRKARRHGLPLDGGAARRFSRGLLPPLLLGVVLTITAWRADSWSMLVPVWLGCYGVGVLAAGAVSTARVVPRFGMSLLVCAAVAAALPLAWQNGMMALGFGVGHLITGEIVRRRYGG